VRVRRSIASSGAVDHIRVEDECDRLLGLVKKQKQICRKNVDMMDAVKSGATIAIQECQQQFANRRWNCSTIDAVSVFGKIHNSGESDSIALSSCALSTDFPRAGLHARRSSAWRVHALMHPARNFLEQKQFRNRDCISYSNRNQKGEKMLRKPGENHTFKWWTCEWDYLRFHFGKGSVSSAALCNSMQIEAKRLR
jgi:hypothetical protein